MFYDHALMLHCGSETKCIRKYMNLLHYNHCKSPIYFGNLLWPSSGRYFFEAYIIKTNKTMNNYKILGFKFVIHNICQNIKCR
jgi:hypothetical protein